ncbi:nuclear transport factor 2 family protein [Novosphingobium colocasiae]
MPARRNKADMRALLDGFLGAFDTFEFRVEQAIADGDWVAIKGASTGTGPGTARYENTYHLLFHYRDGKVLEVRELFRPLSGRSVYPTGRSAGGLIHPS